MVLIFDYLLFHLLEPVLSFENVSFYANTD